MCVCLLVSLSAPPTHKQLHTYHIGTIGFREQQGEKLCLKTIKHGCFLKINQLRRVSHKSNSANTFSIIPPPLDLRFRLLLSRNVCDQIGRVNVLTIELLCRRHGWLIPKVCFIAVSGRNASGLWVLADTECWSDTSVNNWFKFIKKMTGIILLWVRQNQA